MPSSAQAALQQKLKALALDRKNEQRAVELAAVVKQAELQRAQKQVKQLTQELLDEQASAERAGRRAALECHNMRKARSDAISASTLNCHVASADACVS